MTLRYASTGRLVTGKVRKHNEDAILIRDDVGLWVVADGMGGHSAGDYASGLLVDRLGLVQRNGNVFDFIEAIEDAVVQVNTDLLCTAAERGVDVIGTTLVLLVHSADFMLCGWVGDSRGYCYEQGRLNLITEDHVHGGIKQDITQFGGGASVQPAPGAGVLTRAIGAEHDLFIDWVVAGCRPGMRFLLCSDGINKEMSDDEIEAEFKRLQEPEALADKLIEIGMERRGRDNMAAVIVQLYNE